MQIRLTHPLAKRVKLKAKRDHRSPTQTVLIMVQDCLDADDGNGSAAKAHSRRAAK